jgi:hypothetical protein
MITAMKPLSRTLLAAFLAAMATTPEALRDFTRAEVEKWGKLIREAGIRAD